MSFTFIPAIFSIEKLPNYKRNKGKEKLHVPRSSHTSQLFLFVHTFIQIRVYDFWVNYPSNEMFFIRGKQD
jgi:hypothetical protein